MNEAVEQFSVATSSVTGSTGATFGKAVGFDRAARGARYLQPQTLGSVIRNTVTIYFQNWATISLIYILPLLPVAMLRGALEEYESGWSVILYLVQLLGGILVGAALVIAVSDVCIGLKPNLRRAYRRGFANGRLLGTYFLGIFFVYTGFKLLVIPGLVFAVWCMFSLPVTVLEPFGGRAALRRSYELGRGFYWRNVGISLVIWAFGFMVLVAGGILIGLFDDFVLRVSHPDFVLWVSHPVLKTIAIEALSIALYGPLISISLILLYYDMRARKESYGSAQLVEDLRI